jgi:hypothetical protein
VNCGCPTAHHQGVRHAATRQAVAYRSGAPFARSHPAPLGYAPATGVAGPAYYGDYYGSAYYGSAYYGPAYYGAAFYGRPFVGCSFVGHAAFRRATFERCAGFAHRGVGGRHFASVRGGRRRG